MTTNQASTMEEVCALVKNILSIHPCLREEELILKVMASTVSDWNRKRIQEAIDFVVFLEDIIHVSYSFQRGVTPETRHLYFIRGTVFEFN